MRSIFPMTTLDTDLFRAFLAVHDAGGFTRAAERLGRSQSTVSLQIQKLEHALGGRSLFQRSGRGTQLTPDGELLLAYARQMLRIAEEVSDRFGGTQVAGTVRVGVPEDFATFHLPEVLARFSDAHPRIALDVRCELTIPLLDGFRDGAFDIVLVKREPQGPGGGVRVWREHLVWAACDARRFAAADPLPLVLAPTPCVYRRRAIRALDALGRRWRIAYTSPSLAGALAAVRAGLGVTVLPVEMVPAGLVELTELPALDEAEIALLRAGSLNRAGELLAAHIVRSLEGIEGPAGVDATRRRKPRRASRVTSA